MTTPGFTAEVSLYSRGVYDQAARISISAGEVIPAAPDCEKCYDYCYREHSDDEERLLECERWCAERCRWSNPKKPERPNGPFIYVDGVPWP